jgi:hypothetical protein
MGVEDFTHALRAASSHLERDLELWKKVELTAKPNRFIKKLRSVTLLTVSVNTHLLRHARDPRGTT